MNAPIIPFFVSKKEIKVLTSGCPADVGTVEIPDEVGRYITMLGIGAGMRIVAEVGNANGAQFILRNAFAGLGDAMSVLQNGPDDEGESTVGNGSPKITTARQLVIRQMLDSGSEGTLSVYVTVVPMP